ncbi:OASL2 protein, partial [Crypturellus soui]|nr:OASL2 protein [Crypturellus soui]
LERVSQRELDAWIARNLEPSTAFSRQVKETVKKICDFLKEQCFDSIRVHKTVKGGSTGKGTALKNNSDADIVVFLSCFSSYQDQKERRAEILNHIEKMLEQCRATLTFSVMIINLRRKGRFGTSARSLSLTLQSASCSESVDVDVLPAYDALGRAPHSADVELGAAPAGAALAALSPHTGQVIQDAMPDPNVYVKLLAACGDLSEFSPCFTELQKLFVKRCPTKLKNLLRLVKYWYKEVLKPRNPSANLPPKYALELLTIYAWEQGTGASEDFSMAEGFRTVLELLCQHQKILIYWEKYYSLQHPDVGGFVKNLLLQSSRPVILDPADPTGILGQRADWVAVAKEATRCRCLPCVAFVHPWNVQPARPVTVEIKRLTGHRLTMSISLDTTILELKRRISAQWDIPVFQQCLGQQEPGRAPLTLQDSATLAASGFLGSTTLMLLQTEDMEVLVKDNCRTTPYTVRPTDTVQELKLKIYKKQRVHVDQQQLMFDSKQLEDQYTLAHYGIQSKSVIYLLLRLRGGTDH